MAEKDYIEREAAMAAACKALCHLGFLCPDFKCAEVRDAFNAIPAADVRPVLRGMWVPDYDYTEYDIDGSTPLPEPRKFQDGWQCSLCGGYTPSETNFCPNCGADMREES